MDKSKIIVIVIQKSPNGFPSQGNTKGHWEQVSIWCSWLANPGVGKMHLFGCSHSIIIGVVVPSFSGWH
jgi:hypothetical protein